MDELPSSRWSLLRVDDLGAQEHLCDCCQKERVRYVHLLAHPTGARLRVGCVCSARLTGDEEGAQTSEREARNRASRYQTFADEKHWAIEADRQTRAGRHLHWDYMAMIYAKPEGWRWMIVFSRGRFISPGTFASAEEARRDLFMTQFE